MSRRPKILIYGNDVAGFRWRLRAANGRTIAASSEAFATRKIAVRNAWLTMRALIATVGAWTL